MRSPHNSQPTVNLGDDPDPAAEIGPRLAAASQTVQGLLTNYLFYGQRRSAQQDQLLAQTGTTARAEDQRHSQDGGSASERTAHTVRSQRPRQGGHDAGTEVAQARQPSLPMHASGTATLRLVERHQEREQAGAVSTGSAGSGRDALAVDPLRADPLSRDPLSSPAESAPQTSAQAPAVPALP